MLRTLRRNLAGSAGSTQGRAASSSGERVKPLRRVIQVASVRSRFEPLALAAILTVSACLNLLQLTREGYANSYYAAAVKSMLQSWHNLFFVSFDPGGFVTIDKPPLGFWIQTASAKLFGFHGWSLLLPQAVAGVFSVAVLFLVVRRVFGPVAGLLAALALAVTPISVATNRNNTIDSLLVLTVLLAAWAVLKATEHGRLAFLLLGMALVGLGFNIKTLEAFLVLPALVLVYFLAAPIGWRRRILHLAAGGVVLGAVSLAWVAAVDLTPASQRPYVGSSQHNSELELALGYNGLQRFFGGSRSAPRIATTVTSDGATASTQDAAGQTARGSQGGPPAGFGGPGGNGGPGGVGENGPVGVFRLLDRQLGGQIGWLIPAAVIGFLAAWQMGLRRRPDRRHQSLIVWGIWFLTCAVFFSKALFFHRYYLSMVAPPIAALFGIGAVALWQAYRQRRLRGWLLPLALLVTAAVQAYILRPYTGWSTWLTPIVVIPCIVAALVLVIVRLPLRLKLPARALAGVAALGVLTLLIAPAVWAGDTVRNNAAAGAVFGAGPSVAGIGGFGGPGGPPPTAGSVRSGADGSQVAVDSTGDGEQAFPRAVGDGGQGTVPAPPSGASGDGGPPPTPGGGFGPGGPGGGVSKQLEAFLLANQGSATYLIAVSGAGEAEQLILDTGKPVMAMGGFTGSDPILTPQSFAALVKQGLVRFVRLGGMGGGASGPSTWVQASCSVVLASDLQAGGATTNSPSSATGVASQQLYDCATTKQ